MMLGMIFTVHWSASGIRAALTRVLSVAARWWRALLGVGNAGRSARQPAARDAALAWRTPLWRWQCLSWLAVTLAAPTSLIIGALLWRDARSDHPLFWPALIALVALVNALTILRINADHRRHPFATRARLAARYFGLCLGLGSAGFLLLGWSTSFLQDFAVPLCRAFGVDDTPSRIVSVFFDVVLALLFGVISFAHAGILHAWLGFREGRGALPKAVVNRRWRHCVPPKA
jgi:hypothetical protein